MHREPRAVEMAYQIDTGSLLQSVFYVLRLFSMVGASWIDRCVELLGIRGITS